VRAGVSCRHTWEPELVSPFHHDRSWTNFGVFCLFVGGACFVGCLLFCCPWPFRSFSFVYPWQLTLWYNDCHYRDDERSNRPKKKCFELARLLRTKSSVFGMFYFPAFFWLVAAWLNVSVVRAVTLLSATTGWKCCKNTGNIVPSKATKSNTKTPSTLQSPGECKGRVKVACSSDGSIKGWLATPRARMSTVRRGRHRLFQILEGTAIS